MRDNIIYILCAYDQDKYGVDMSGKRKINVEKAADELAAFMCHREVRQIVLHRTVDSATNLEAIIIDSLKNDYPEQTIREAIDKVKNEMK